jgi:hypothetical protein
LPPRAGKRSLSRLLVLARKGLRRLGALRLLNSSGFSGFWRKIRLRDYRLIVFSLLPGLGNVSRGRFMIGGLWFSLWLALWYSWFYYLTGYWFSISAAILLHLASLVSYWWPLRFRYGKREWRISLIVSATALSAIYYAVVMAALPFKPVFIHYPYPSEFSPAGIPQGSNLETKRAATDFQPGDIAVINAELASRRGDLAFLAIWLAGSGQTVEYSDGVMQVDGVELAPRWSYLFARLTRSPQAVRFRVKDGFFLALANPLHQPTSDLSAPDFPESFQYPESRRIGKVEYVHTPDRGRRPASDFPQE